MDPSEWDFVPAVYCISLQERDDRMQQAKQEFDQVGLGSKVQWHRPHRDPRGGEAGCWDSHVAVVKKAVEANHPFVLIFEDDVVFHSDIKAKDIRQIRRTLEETLARREWGILFLGQFPFGGVPITANLDVWRTSSLLAHAYFISYSLMRKLLDNSEYPGMGIDMWYSRQRKTYSIYPPLAYQRYEQVSDNQRNRKNIEPIKQWMLSKHGLPKMNHLVLVGVWVLIIFVVMIAIILAVKYGRV